MNINNIRLTIDSDIPFVSNNLRNSDKDEIYASTGNRLYYGVLLESVKLSEKCFTWTINEKPTMILGICEGGVIWALGTDEFKKEKRFFLKEGMNCINELSKGYKKIHNYVYEDNTTHIRWLKRVGFIFDKEPVVLKNGEKFLYFSMEIK